MKSLASCPHNQDVSDKYRIVQTVKLRIEDAVGVDQRKLVRLIVKIVLLVEKNSQTDSKICLGHCKIAG